MPITHQRTFAMAAPLFCIVALYSSTSLADNPIVQSSYTADPAPMVYEDRLYLYTSHDEDVTVSNFYTMNDWHLYSTVDMVNWKDHGTPAGLKNFKWGTDSAWAPQCVARNGKFYLYVPLNNNTGARIGVAVATDPAGPFTDPIGKELVSNGSMAIDPTVFIDDDGQAYLYWGNGNLRFVKLNSDMISTSGSVTSNVAMNGFTEGPWFYKRGSLYYLVYAGSSEKISYATSNAPAGPWTYKGDVMGAPTIATNHPGVVDFKGHSYFFYHNGTLPGGGSFKRSVCVEEFTYGTDGSIPKISMSTAGPTALATLNPYDRTEAETIAWGSGIKTEVCSEGGMDVTAITSGDYIKVKNVDFGTGATSFTARVAATASGGSIQIRLGSQTGTLVGTCTVPATGGNQTWADSTCAISGASGTKDLFFVFAGSAFNFNHWQFTGSGSVSAGTGGTGSTSTSGGAAGSGATTGAGGTKATGGISSLGGYKATGGDTASAGAAATTGGVTAVGGTKATGGMTSTSNTGGSTRSANTGGTPSAGGIANVSGGKGSGGQNGFGGITAVAVGGGQASGGLPGTSSLANSAVATGDNAGCSCNVAGEQLPARPLAVFGALGLFFLRSSRRRRSS